MFDFETLVNRGNQGALKWNVLKEDEKQKGIIPYSVADMEFKIAPAIIDGLKAHLETDILGYTGPTDAYYEAVISFMERHHGLHISKEVILTTPGVVVALLYAVEAFTKAHEGVVILSPVYYPFSMVIEQQDRVIVRSELVNEDNAYHIDFEDLEAKLARNDVTMMIFCSPHNPIGRVWSKEEVSKVVSLCKKHHVFLISDEIHMDLMMSGYTHYSAGLLEEYRDNMMICTSCSKTFNLAGMQVSNILVFNEERRTALKKVLDLHHVGTLNNLAYKACILAYTKCDDWLEALLAKLNENRELVKKYVEQHMPNIKVIELQGTYLQWLDLRYLNLSKEALEKQMIEHSLYFDEGYVFGEGGIGFERINLACPTSKILEMLERLEEAVNHVK